MTFDEFKATTGAGGEVLARQAWEQVVTLCKAALPANHAEIDAALAPAPVAEVVTISASDVGNARDIVGA